MSFKLLPFGRASMMLDIVTLAMVVILPLVVWAIYVVRVKKNHRLHRRIQKGIGGVLCLAIALFEIDMRFNGWQHLAEPSPYFSTFVFPALYVHLMCAVTTVLLWSYTFFLGLKRVPSPNKIFAMRHRQFGQWSALMMFTTAFTGWTFYWLAFVA